MTPSRCESLIAERLPPSGATEVDPRAPLVITFSETISPGKGHITITNLWNGFIRRIDVANANEVSVARNVLTIRPITGIDFSTQYAVTIEPGVITDHCGHALDGAQWRFATAPYNDAVASVDMDLAAGPDRTAARSRLPTVQGSARLVGAVRRLTSGGAADVQVRVDGTEIWRRRLAASDALAHGFDILALDLTAESRVEFVLEPDAPADEIEVNVNLNMLPEPFASAWSTEMPDGYPRWTDAERAQLRAAGQSVLQQIRDASSSGQRQVVIQPGDYLFNADWSKHSTLTGIRDLEIVANSVTFWFEPPMIRALMFENCRNVFVQGLTIDFTRPVWFQARLTEIDRQGETLRATFMPGYEPIDAEGQSETAGNRAMMFYDARGRFINSTHTPADWKREGDGLVIDNFGRTTIPPALRVGDYVVGTLRTGPALHVADSASMRFEDLCIWSAPGIAVVNQRGEGGHVYRRVRATRRPFTNRLQAFGADVFHFAGQDCGPVMDRCEAAYAADDTLNIHGVFGHVVERADERSYYLDGAYAVGDAIEFWDVGTAESLGEARVVSAIAIDDGPTIALNERHKATGAYLVTLDRALELAPLSLVVMDGKRGGERWVVRNCWFHDDFQRTLINGSPGGLLENTTIQNTGHGLHIEYDIGPKWMEGPFPSDTTVHGNRFIDAPPDATSVNTGGHAIRVGGLVNGREIPGTPIRSLTITGNYFSRAAHPPVFASQVDGLRIEGNSIDLSLKNRKAETDWLISEGCRNVSVLDNQIHGAPMVE